VEPDVRDAVVDFIRDWAEKSGMAIDQLLEWLGLSVGKFYQWRQRYGKINQHNGGVPRDFWLQDWEKKAILDFQELYPAEGYRRLTYMMLDHDVVAVSPSSVFRVLSEGGRLQRWSPKPSKKGTGFEQPSQAHEHWHIDIAHINIHGTFYYLCAVLDGASRYLVAWGIRESMTEADVEVILQRAKERFPEARPRIISDNGPQFIAKDFKEFHSHLRDDARPDGAVLPPIEWEIGALEQIDQKRVHPSWRAAVAGRCRASGGAVCHGLQRAAPAQRVGLYHAACPVAGPASRDPRGPRSQTRAGAPAARTGNSVPTRKINFLLKREGRIADIYSVR